MARKGALERKHRKNRRVSKDNNTNSGVTPKSTSADEKDGDVNVLQDDKIDNTEQSGTSSGQKGKSKMKSGSSAKNKSSKKAQALLTGKLRFGIIGPGPLLLFVAKKIINFGCPVSIFNRLGKLPGEMRFFTSKSLPELADKSDVIFDCVNSMETSKDIILNVETGITTCMHPGTGYVELGLTSASTAVHAQKLITAAKGYYLEAPIFSPLDAVKRGRGIMVCSGSLELYERIKPLLDSIAKNSFNEGAGSASIMNTAFVGIRGAFGVLIEEMRNYLRANKLDEEVFSSLLLKSQVFGPKFSTTHGFSEIRPGLFNELLTHQALKQCIIDGDNVSLPGIASIFETHKKCLHETILRSKSL